MLQYLIMAPLAAGFLIVLFGKRFKYLPESIACAASSALVYVSLFSAKSALANKSVIFKVGNWMPPYGIPLVCDSLSGFVLVIANFVILAVTVYSVGYAKQFTDNWKYYALLMIAAAGVNGVVLTGDLFNLFVFLEIASIATYALVAFTLDDEALEGAFKYAVQGAIASSFILLGMAVLYSYTSTLNMADMALVISVRAPAKIIPFVSALFVMGFGLKAAFAPFHAWMPDAYTKAPVTVPALSSGVLIKTLGIYSLARIFFNVFGMSENISLIFTILAVGSMVMGGVLALEQSNLRRLLAYSSISQVGYILLALGVGTPLAIMGGLFHLLNHSAAKALIFLGVGVVEGDRGTSDIDKMSSIASSQPVAGYSTLLGAMSISGVPPFGGFWSKIIIIFACIQAHHPFLAAVAVAVSVVTLIYYFKAFTPILFGPAGSPAAAVTAFRPGWSMNLAMISLAAIVVAGGLILMPGVANLFLNHAVSTLVNGTTGYIAEVLGTAR